MFQYVLLFLLAWPTKTHLFNPDEIATVLEPICDNDYEDCIPNNYDDCEDKVTYDIGESELEYQPSGEGGARSLPATPHRLQNPKWPPGGPKMADGVWKGVYS